MEQELITLGILFFFALIGGILAARFKQPILMGLLIVGAAIGPHAFGIVHNENMMEIMIEFGAILILFMLGLEFDLEKLKKIGLKSILIAVLNSAVLIFAGFIVGVVLGYPTQASLFMGVIIAFGSTVVIVKVLENKGLMDRQEVPLLIAILIMEDLIAVMIITFFSGIQDTSVGLIGNIESLIISLCILAIGYVLFVKLIKPLLVALIKSTPSEEITIFLALAMCAGFGYAAYALHLSPAVGAFLAGSIIASLPNAKEFQHGIEPYNLIISSFFFLAIGTLINIQSIIDHIMIILILVAVVFIVKIVAFSLMVYFFANLKGDHMFFSSIAMFSIGEFSLLVAKEGAKFNIGIDLVSISAAIIAISAILMTFAIMYTEKVSLTAKERVPFKFQQKIDKFASYIRSVSEELDLDNKYSRGLKSAIASSITTLFGILLIGFGWKRLSPILTEQVSGAVHQIAFIAIIVIALGLGAVFVYYTRKTIKMLSDIFANATNIRNPAHTRRIVLHMFLAVGFATIGFAAPFIMFLFKTNTIYVIGAVVLLIASLWQFKCIASLIEYHNAPYKESMNSMHKWDNHLNHKETKTTNVNNGWKI